MWGSRFALGRGPAVLLCRDVEGNGSATFSARSGILQIYPQHNVSGAATGLARIQLTGRMLPIRAAACMLGMMLRNAWSYQTFVEGANVKRLNQRMRPWQRSSELITFGGSTSSSRLIGTSSPPRSCAESSASPPVGTTSG